MVRQAVRVSHTSSWPKLDTSLRAYIQELSCLPLEQNVHVTRQSRSTSGSRNLDLRQVKLAIQQHSRRTHSSDSRSKKTYVNKNSKPKPQSEQQPPRPRTWPAQTQIKNKIISSSESSRTSSPAMKKLNKKIDNTIPKVKYSTDKSTNNVTTLITKSKPNNTTKKNEKIMSIQSTSMKLEKIKQKKDVPGSIKQQNSNPMQAKTKSTNNVLKNNNQKAIPVKSQSSKLVPILNKENRTNSGKQSKSGSSSSTQQSPSMVNRNKQTNSSNTSSTPNSQVPYSSSPSLRRSLLLAAKTPQIPVKPMSPATNKRIARIQASNSLTSPTKSSAAKCVSNSSNITRTKVAKQTSISKSNSEKAVEKITVDRSSTFLKDEPSVLPKN